MIHRRRTSCGLTVALLALAAALVAGTASAAPLERSTTDRPDDSELYQIHVMYVLPSDGQDEHLDENGTLATSLAAAENWLAGQADGSRLRFDTYQGGLEITFFRMSRTDAQLRGYGSNLVDVIEAALLAAGFTQSNKLYAVYYGGGNNAACGSAVIPPAGPSTVAAVYLHGTPPGAAPCASNAFASSPTQTPGYLDLVMLHEIVHTLGFVPACAPHHTANGHVNDDPRDLMYAGPLPWRPSILDVGRDDYYNAHHPGCPDLARSAFLDPLPNVALTPPSWPLEELPKIECDQTESLRSQRADVATKVQFVNTTSKTVRIYWLNYNGGTQLYYTLAPLQSYVQATFLTHPWEVTDTNRTCLGVYLPALATGRVIIRDGG